ncbi:MAG: GFA family protein [Pseudomonadota bacterium]
MKLTGRCSCGQVRYEIRNEPLFTQACHCTDCQRTTGSAFVIHAVVCEEDVDLTGETKMSLAPTGSGAGCELHACATCGVIIWVRYCYHQVPVIAIRAGTFTDTGALVPQAHIFTSRKQSWVNIPSDVPAFAEGLDRDAVWPSKSIERYQNLPKLVQH